MTDAPADTQIPGQEAIQAPQFLAPGQIPPPEEAEEAPYGWMTDAEGVRRPRKRPGRRPKGATAPAGKSPAIEELQALGSLPETGEDTAPAAPKGRRRRPPKEPEPLPPFRAGVISKGVNGIYRKAGRLARLMHHDIGTAIIQTTYAADDDDITVGEAWENVAKTNPRIRAFWLKIIAGGAMGDLFVAHLPIAMAVLMVDGIRNRLPLARLAEAVLSDDDGPDPQSSDLSQMLGGINPQDMAQMMQMAQTFMGDVAANVPRTQGIPREPVIEHGQA